MIAGLRRRSARVRAKDDAANAWADAGALLAHLTGGGYPAPLTVWGLVLQPGEHAFAHLPVGYARLYGHDVTGYYSSPLIIGHPALVIGGLIGSALGNARTRREVAAANAVIWRDHQHGAVVVTDRRLIVHAYGEWLSFSYDAVAVFHPDLSAWTTVLDFPAAAPLRLHGPATALLNTYLCWALHGLDGLHRHPGLDLLRAAAWPGPAAEMAL